MKAGLRKALGSCKRRGASCQDWGRESHTTVPAWPQDLGQGPPHPLVPPPLLLCLGSPQARPFLPPHRAHLQVSSPAQSDPAPGRPSSSAHRLGPPPCGRHSPAPLWVGAALGLACVPWAFTNSPPLPQESFLPELPEQDWGSPLGAGSTPPPPSAAPPGPWSQLTLSLTCLPPGQEPGYTAAEWNAFFFLFL